MQALAMESKCKSNQAQQAVTKSFQGQQEKIPDQADKPSDNHDSHGLSLCKQSGKVNNCANIMRAA
jgi:hypothetical protein